MAISGTEMMINYLLKSFGMTAADLKKVYTDGNDAFMDLCNHAKSIDTRLARIEKALGIEDAEFVPLNQINTRKFQNE